jgi:ubiquinone/menaquinone biosynthesis C-methylase UbiE
VIEDAHAEAPPVDPGTNRDHGGPVSVPIDLCHVSIEEGYELWAPSYDLAPNPLLALEARELKPRFPNLKGRYVLDVACGTGRWLEGLLSRGARSGVGVDLSSAMLAVATAKATLRGRLVRADCLSLPFRSELADLVVCSFALAHLRGLAAFAGELSRLARRGADTFVTDLHPQAYAAGWRSAFRHSRGVVEIPAFVRPVEQVLSAFATCGFELLECVESKLSEPEKQIFGDAKKPDLFEQVRHVPAVLICHFARS